MDNMIKELRNIIEFADYNDYFVECSDTPKEALLEALARLSYLKNSGKDIPIDSLKELFIRE